MTARYCDEIREHYVACWGLDVREVKFDRGPLSELPADFRVLRFAPRSNRNMWTYATQCMSQPDDEHRLELHLFAAEDRPELAELLVATAHYHRTGARLSLGHTVNFGRPWLERSSCDHGLVSLPYLDGPLLEWLRVAKRQTRFLWLIPITKDEVEFARKSGLDALESRFEASQFNYLDPTRGSVA